VDRILAVMGRKKKWEKMQESRAVTEECCYAYLYSKKNHARPVRLGKVQQTVEGKPEKEALEI